MGTDYDQAFAATEITAIGPVHLPTGSVVACDPYFADGAEPFLRKSARGIFQVEIGMVQSTEWGKRVALARMVFQPGVQAVTFQPAVKDAEGTSGYFVEAGVGCFMDEAARDALVRAFAAFYERNPQGNYYADVLCAEFKKNAVNPEDPTDTGEWILYHVPGSDLEVAIFTSGLGDGWYESWWGLDRDGQITSLVTDFGLI